MKTAGKEQSSPNRTVNWVWISAIAFLLSFLASGVLIFFGRQLDELGITGNIYYIILVPLGFSCAAFLAGAMKSYASYKSNAPVPYGSLKLSGPVVIFALVVGGGFVMPNLNKANQFDVKMRIVSVDKPTNEFNEGSIVVYVGKALNTIKVHEGEIVVPNIPIAFNNKKLRIEPSIRDYSIVGPHEVTVSKDKDYIDLNFARTDQSRFTTVRGSVVDEKGRVVKNAFLDFESGLDTCHTNEAGNFSLTVKLPEGQQPSLRVFVAGDIRFQEPVTISSSIPINIKLPLATKR